jgi:hypothetical protein
LNNLADVSDTGLITERGVADPGAEGLKALYPEHAG